MLCKLIIRILSYTNNIVMLISFVSLMFLRVSSFFVVVYNITYDVHSYTLTLLLGLFYYRVFLALKLSVLK